MPRRNKEPAPGAAAPAPSDPRAASRADLALASGLGLCTFLALLCTEQGVGVPRDESFYFRAASDYAGWFKTLLSTPGRAFDDDVIRRFYGYNTEHPALMKELFGLSHWLFFERLHWLREMAAFRLPTFVLAGLFAAVLYLFGTGLRGRVAGAFAVGAFFLTPRNFFHAHLAAFDFPICAMWLLVVWACWRAEHSRKFAVLTGVLFGLALATKHNAFFLPPVLVGTWLITRGVWVLRDQGAVAFGRAIPLAFWSMALLGPLVFYLHWPYVWHAPVERVGFWIAFHLRHDHYAWYYLGTLMREPPFPIVYPFVVTAMTVPAAIVLAMALGYGRALATGVRSLVEVARKRAAAVDADTWLLLVNGVVSLAIIAPPSVPHFGGEKHWMPSMPFLCILAGEVVARGGALLASRLRLGGAPPLASAALALLVLAPALWGCVAIGGYGTSFYNELTGGNAGAAALGMQRQFWSNNVTGVLPWLNENAPPHARVFFHEVTGDSYRAYQSNGMLRADIQFAPLEQADIACYQYHQEFRFWEYAIWTNLRSRWPVQGLYLDEVPNIECYQRDHAW